ncbi:MAG: DUF262 domain-containing protein [Pseudomonadota bacterium]|nr:DUF262 domain-containing protein [Pseudomonadota bacterium]
MTDSDIVNKFSKAQDSLVIQQSDFSLSTIGEMVNYHQIDISPHYQRRDRWKDVKQSALIESFLLNVPVPPVYLSEDDYGSYSVIDGKQRITAIHDFLNNDLKLKGLKEFPELEGKTFSQLPPQLKNVLSVRPFIRVITLLKQSHPQLKYEVFLRLNTGGEKLKPQEIRNVAYSGPLNDLLFKLAENEFLRNKLKITSKNSTAYRNMDDLEHVLRFLTLRDRWKKMGNVLSEEMDDFMRVNRESDGQNFEKFFNSAIERCQILWGDYAFQKPLKNGWREQLISPLYDAEMVAVTQISDDLYKKLKTKHNLVVNRTETLFEEDADFVKSISQSTNNPSAIYKRVSTLVNMLEDIA